MSPPPRIAPAVKHSPDWISLLRGPPTPAREAALARLHQLLLRATRFALSRRRDLLRHASATELDGLAVKAADDALMSILSRLDEYRDVSRFTTWACKFAIHEAGVTGRRASHGRQDTAVRALRLPSMQRRSSS